MLKVKYDITVVATLMMSKIDANTHAFHEQCLQSFRIFTLGSPSCTVITLVPVKKFWQKDSGHQ